MGSKQTRIWTFVGDIVDGLLRAAEKPDAVGQEMNLASGKETYIIDMVNWVNELTGNKAGLKYIPRRKWDTKDRLWASIEKAKGLIGYEPKTEFKEGLKHTVDWFKENWNKIERSTRF